MHIYLSQIPALQAYSVQNYSEFAEDYGINLQAKCNVCRWFTYASTVFLHQLMTPKHTKQ